jgi:hypothetical protein
MDDMFALDGRLAKSRHQRRKHREAKRFPALRSESDAGQLSLTEPPKDRLIPEAEVLSHRPMLAVGLLLAARKAGTITWTKGKRNSAWYRLSDVDAYIKQRESRCRAPEQTRYSNSADNGSDASRAGKGSGVTGMTPELVEAAALASAQRILK